MSTVEGVCCGRGEKRREEIGKEAKEVKEEKILHFRRGIERARERDRD